MYTILRPTPQRDNSGRRRISELQFERITVPSSLREMIRYRYPGLEKNPAYWRLLQVLLYGTFRDKQTGAPVVPQTMLAEIEGKQSDVGTGLYSGEDFLDRFNRDVFPITYSDYSFTEGRARVITNYSLDTEIALARMNDLGAPWTPKGRVYFATGRTFTRRRQTELREQDRQFVL